VSSVRLAGRADAGEVTRLLIGFRDWFGASAPSAGEMAASVERLLGDPGTEYLLAAAAGEVPSGVCQLRYRHSVWTSAPDCWLEDLYVEERARGRGLGGALVRAALERARGRGARRIELDTNADNAPAIALYEALGFSSASKAHGPLAGVGLLMGRRLDR